MYDRLMFTNDHRKGYSANSGFEYKATEGPTSVDSDSEARRSDPAEAVLVTVKTAHEHGKKFKAEHAVKIY
jgi:hypothetical protein